MTLNLILLGAPGSGKGTQGSILSETLGLQKVATGDLLRAAVQRETPLGLEAKDFMEQGMLVPDTVILGLIDEVLNSSGASRGIIMDGFPRTVAQAEAVDRQLEAQNMQVDHVLSFEVPEAELISRMMGRAAREGRADDTPEAFQQRLQVYREQTAPLLDFYQQRGIVKVLDGTGSIEEIARRTHQAVTA